VLDAFLQAQLDATEFLNQHPLESAKLVADGSGLPQEVVYLYNGPGGTRFDTTLKSSLIQAFKGDVPYLKSIGDFADLDIDGFISDTAIRKAFAERGQDYDAALNSTTNPSALGGQDPVCNVAVTDPKLAGELWLNGKDATQPAAHPGCLLRAIREANARGEQVRAAYVPDTEFGTRWFADKSSWVQDGTDYLPFGTLAGAQRYTGTHPDATVVDYQQALVGAV
jgi:NitT/TauT family transport system substrate-binding protein